MFGISWAEFLVIFLVAVAVIPSRMWPDVARFMARVVNFVRGLVWRATDAAERLKEQVELERPVDEIIKMTTDEMLDAVSIRRLTGKKAPVKKSKTTNKKQARKK